MKALFILSLALLMALSITIPSSAPAHPLRAAIGCECGNLPDRSTRLHQWQMMREQEKQTKLLKQLRDEQEREAIRNEFREEREREAIRRKYRERDWKVQVGVCLRAF